MMPDSIFLVLFLAMFLIAVTREHKQWGGWFTGKYPMRYFMTASICWQYWRHFFFSTLEPGHNDFSPHSFASASKPRQ